MSSVIIAGDTSGAITISAPAVAGTTTLTLPAVSGTILQSGTVVTVAQGGTGVTTSTGTGANVLGTSPTLVTPLLGTPTSGVATNLTGLPLTTGVTGTLPVANGGSGVTTSTGSGANVLGTSPTLTTPVINGFTGDTSVINIGSGQIYKDASGNVGIGTSSPSVKLDVNGSACFGNAIVTGNGASTDDCAIELGGLRTGDGNAYIDMHATSGTDFNFRIIRYGGVNAGTAIQQIGTGPITMTANYAGVQLTNGATAWSAISDETRKDIIEPITEGINKVSQLRAVIGKYKIDAEDKRRAFLIAQDVQKVLPEAVVECEDDNGKYLALAITDVIPLLVASIKEQQAIIIQLQADVAALKGATA